MFSSLQVQRGSGSAKVIIYPHKSGWNDSNAIGPPEPVNPFGDYYESQSIIQKGVIYVDGMLAFEFFGATLGYGSYTPNYLVGGIIGFPADSYSAPSKYGSGLIDIAVNPAIVSAAAEAATAIATGADDTYGVFATENHANWLRPGVYDLSSGSVGLDAEIEFDSLSAVPY